MPVFKKSIWLLVLTVFLACPVTSEAALDENRPNIAVLPYAQRAAVSKELSLEDAAYVSEFLVEQLLDANRFNVIERTQLLAITEEHKLNMSGLVDPSTAVEVGRLAGVKYLVMGSVTGLSTKKSGVSYDNRTAGSVGGKMNTVIANVTARFIDVETGQVILAASGTGESASTYTEFALKSEIEDTDSSAAESDYTDVAYTSAAYSEAGTGESGEYYSEENTGMSSVTTTNNRKRTVVQHKITIGTTEFSQVQVRNALYKAVDDLVFNKNFGILAKLDGKAKHRKV